ncbi:UNVERIFIED_CONTAM: hypothetical protein GTU68_022407 [Idotea baltica]|nr:hypothetical protein [Idotea baltica]
MNYLLDNGFEILARNWRYNHGEIDLIAKKENNLHFVEVKTRKTDNFGRPEEAVSTAKQKKLAETATAFLYAVNGAPECQFDIISIVGNPTKNHQLQYFPDAFFPFE